MEGMMKTSPYFVAMFITFLVALSVIVSADAGTCGMGGMMYGSYGAGPMLFGWLTGILVLIVLALLIV